MKKKVTSMLTAIVLLLSQVGVGYGEILPNNSVVVNRPVVVTHGGTGVPVVNIAAPNAKGLSHNRYDKFDVDSKGVVLNNALTAVNSEIIGEEIEGNVNFTDRAARVILNEIMGLEKSVIKGAVEIAGEKAVLITANPYGIRVDGGSFINTEKAMFVTGVPNIAEEVIKSFRLSAVGAVEIESGGLMTNDPVEIISRYTKLSGELKAKSIDIKAGNKEYEVNEETGEWEISSENSEDEPAEKYAVSAWAFGSMYGDRIKIVSTEEGFGVKTAEDANMISAASDITINAEGKIEIGANITSKRNTELKANEDISVTGNITAGEAASEAEEGAVGNISIETSKVFENLGIMRAEGKAEVEGEHVKNENGEIKAVQDVTIKAERDIGNEYGVIKSGGNTSLSAERIKNEKGEIKSAENITFVSGRLSNAYGKIEAEEDIRFDFKGKDAETDGEIKAGEVLLFENTGRLENAGTLEGNEIKLDASELENKAGGKIISEEGMEINSGEIKNGGQLRSGGDMELKSSGWLESSGMINAGGFLKVILAGELINRFMIRARNLSVSSGNIINNNANITVEEKIEFKTGGIENSYGKISSEGDLSIEINDKDFTAGGEYASGGRLTFGGIKNFINTGALSGGSVEITSEESFFNDSTIISSGDMKIISLEIKNQNGKIRAGNDLKISGKNLFNEKTAVTGSGEISGKNVFIEIIGKSGNKNGKIESTCEMEIRAEKIVNESEKLYGHGEIKGVNITMTADNIENKSASISATGSLQIKGENIVNERKENGVSFLEESIIRGDILSVTGKSGGFGKSFINGYSKVETGTSMSILSDRITNTAVMLPESSGESYILKRKDYRLGDVPGNLYASADYVISAGGLMESLGSAELKTNLLDNISGDIKAGGDLNISAEKINNKAYSINAPSEYGGGELYASLASGGSISGGNIAIRGLNGVNAAELNNIISSIKASNELNIRADKIENKAVENINLTETRGISVIRNSYVLKTPYNGSYGVLWDETPEVLHSATQGVLSGDITRISGEKIVNESSVIEGMSMLEINAAELINRAFMFKDKLQVFYETRGAEKKYDWGWKERNQSRSYIVEEEYTFVSNTAGEIKGGDIDIKLRGSLIQDENHGALIRGKDGMNRVIYSNITAQEGLKIEAGNIYNYGGLQSGGLMDINTVSNFLSYDAKLIAGSLKIYAGKDYYNVARVEYHEYGDWEGDGQFWIKEPYINGYGIFMVSVGDSEIRSGNMLKISGIEGRIRGDSNITMKSNGVFDGVEYALEWMAKVYEKKRTEKIPGLIKGGMEILGNSVVESENGSIRESGYVKEVGGDSSTKAKEDIIIESIMQEEVKTYESASEDKLFGSSEKNSTRNVKITNIGSSTKVGGKLELIAGNNINVLASSLESLAGIVSLTAGMDINVLAGEEYESAVSVKTKSGTLGFGSEKEEKEEGVLTTAASSIKGQGVIIKAGKDATVTGSDLDGGEQGILVTAGNDINVVPGADVRKSVSSSEKGDAVSGSEINKRYDENGVLRNVNMKTAGDILLIAGNDIMSVSGNYEAGGDVVKAAGYVLNGEGALEKSGKAGKLKEYTAEGYNIHETYNKKTDGLAGALASWEGIRKIVNPLSGFAEGWEKGFQTMLNPSNADIGVSWQGVSASVSFKEEEDKTRTEDRIAKVNTIKGSKVTLKAVDSVTSLGTRIEAENDINIEGKNILLLSAQNRSKNTTSHEEKTLTTGMKVGNAYVDAGFAAKALYDAEQALEKATYELRDMEKLEKEGKASKDAVEDAKVNLAMATANVANAVLGLAASVAGAATAASSSYGTGLYVAGFANYDSNKMSMTSEELYATQSNLFANNITFKSENDMTQEGTSAYAGSKITYNIGNDLLIQASKNTMASERKSEHLSGGVSVGNNAVQVSASAGQSSERMRATSYENSEVTAKDIEMNVGNNATLSGVNIHAADNLAVNVANNLTIESLQDSYYAKGNSWDASVSVGIGTDRMGKFMGGSKSNGQGDGGVDHFFYGQCDVEDDSSKQRENKE